jgi:hypothetical protein
MFPYSFLGKNLACALLFEIVRLLIFEGSRFFFQYFWKKKSKLLFNHVIWPKIGMRFIF